MAALPRVISGATEIARQSSRYSGHLSRSSSAPAGLAFRNCAVCERVRWPAPTVGASRAFGGGLARHQVNARRATSPGLAQWLEVGAGSTVILYRRPS